MPSSIDSGLFLWDWDRCNAKWGEAGRSPVRGSNDPNPLFVSSNRMLPLRRIRAIESDDGPVVVKGLGSDIASDQHRFNCKDHAGLNARSAQAGPVVEDVRCLVHGRADPMTHIVF